MIDLYSVTVDFTSKGYPRRKVYCLYADSLEHAKQQALDDCARFEEIEHPKVSRVRKLK